MKKLLFLLLAGLPAAARPTPPADAVLLRQFLEAVADERNSDSLIVARFMCPDLLFRRNEPRVDTMVAILRESLLFLRHSLQANLPSLRRCRFVPFKDLPHKPFVLTDGEQGAYVALDGDKPQLYLLVRDQRVVSFTVSRFQGKADFFDHCR